MDNGFGLEQHTGRHDFYHRIKGADDRVGLRLVLTGRAKPFPNKSHSVQPQDFDPLIGKEQHLFHHGSEYFRI